MYEVLNKLDCSKRERVYSCFANLLLNGKVSEYVT